MFSTADTIVAVATPGGRGGLGVVRLSGADAPRVACELLQRTRALEPRRAHVARLRAGRLSDQVVATFFPAPHSYTTEDVVEISAHGSPVVLQAIVQEAIARGARLARPGEFTFRAFIHGRLDLAQAEAVADLIDAMTPRQAMAASAQLDGRLSASLHAVDAALLDLISRLEASLDFPDEGYHFVTPGSVGDELAGVRSEIDRLLEPARHGRLVREGVRVVLLGRPNTGKSSIFNWICRTERAIVAPLPGTTRDVITEPVDLAGVPVTLVDTAGVRESADPVEQEGVRRSASAAGAADLILAVFDVSEPLNEDDRQLLARTAGRPRILIANKCDRPRMWPADALADGAPACAVSALSGDGMDALVATIGGWLGAPSWEQEPPAVTNERHIQLLRRCAALLDRATTLVHERGSAAPEEVLLVELNAARETLDEIAGRRTADDVLARIFDRFCVGK